MQTALQVASARGLDVRLLISSKSQHPHAGSRRAAPIYDALLRQGVQHLRVREGRRALEVPGSSTRDWVTVGSCNLDERSLRLNFELSLLVYDQEMIPELSWHF